MSAPLVQAQAISKSYRSGDSSTHAVREVSLAIEPGELVLLMGPSGSGKTTLLSMLAGLLRPSSGTIELCGHTITALPPREVTKIRRRHLGFVFQSYNLLAALTALDNIAEPLTMKGYSLRDARQQARSALDRVGLSQRAHHYPADLSGGERQRVALARAWAGEPALIFGDEPTAALDGKTSERVVALLREAVTRERSVLLVTHDGRLEPYAHRILQLEDGVIIDERRIADAPPSKADTEPNHNAGEPTTRATPGENV